MNKQATEKIVIKIVVTVTEVLHHEAAVSRAVQGSSSLRETVHPGDAGPEHAGG